MSKLLTKINFVWFITDFNECNTNNNGGCDHNCINTQGSYQCQCREGYETNNNGINCTGMMFLNTLKVIFYTRC